jgi:NhaP-type Na+/H+ or K+/H+ antiporter
MSPYRVAWIIVILGGLTALSSILASILGAQAILLAVGSTIFTIVLAGWTAELQARQRRTQAAELDQRQKQQQLERYQQELLERRKELALDKDCAALLQRAKTAVEAILVSQAYAHNLMHEPVNEKELRENAQFIFEQSQEITDLRAKQRSIIANSSRPCDGCGGRGEVRQVTRTYLGATETSRSCPACRGTGRAKSGNIPGRMTAAVLEPQQRALAMALASMAVRVERLEHYASAVREVDISYTDWIGAQQAERLNDRFRNIVIKTAEDKLAVEELSRLTEVAAAAERAFRHSVQEADLAAETLALPDEK